MQNLCEQVVVWCIIQDNIGAVVLLDHAMEGDDIWMRASKLVKSNFTNMDLALPNAMVWLSNEAFDSIGFEGMSVHGTINDAITANAQDLDEFQSSTINQGPNRGMGGSSGDFVRHGDEGVTRADGNSNRCR